MQGKKFLVWLVCFVMGFFFYLIHNLSLRKLIYELNKKNDTFFKSSTPTKKQQQKSNNKKEKYVLKIPPHPQNQQHPTRTQFLPVSASKTHERRKLCAK